VHGILAVGSIRYGVAKFLPATPIQQRFQATRPLTGAEDINMPPRAKSNKPTRPASKNAAAVQMAPPPHQQDVVHRLRRVEGQIRGVLTMIERDEACDAIAQQLAAARKALDRAFYEMMACSLEMELQSTPTDDKARERIAEKTRLLAKYA
jgi:DNA-binding FrmR family transcriptional regulator